ncbi:thymidylate synthase, partial [Bacillus spizizenii]|nr:thymidylate synthase [Bacillus spizizenii]
SQMEREQFEAPELWINPEVKDFYDFTIDDFKLFNYKHGDKLLFEVAV